MRAPNVNRHSQSGLHRAAFAVPLPELFHFVVTVARDDHLAPAHAVPHEHAALLGVILEHVEVGLRVELVVEHAVLVREAVALQRPQLYLVGDRWRKDGRRLVALRMRVLPEERDYLFGRDATSERLPYAFARDDADN